MGPFQKEDILRVRVVGVQDVDNVGHTFVEGVGIFSGNIIQNLVLCEKGEAVP